MIEIIDINGKNLIDVANCVAVISKTYNIGSAIYYCIQIIIPHCQPIMLEYYNEKIRDENFEKLKI